MIEFIATVLSLIMIIVFFVISSNITKIRKASYKQVQQNDEIISLLKRSTGLLTNEDKAKAFDQQKGK